MRTVKLSVQVRKIRTWTGPWVKMGNCVLQVHLKHPEWSLRKISKLVGVDHSELSVQVCGISHLDRHEGEDGKSYPESAEASDKQRASIQDAITEHPEKSDRQIAKDFGVSDHTGADVRQRMDSENNGQECPTSQSARLDRTTGSDGKARPANESPAEQQRVTIGPEFSPPLLFDAIIFLNNTMKNFKNTIRVIKNSINDCSHEKFQVMPSLTPEEYEDLKEDIRERGVMVPIEYDEDGNALDGFNWKKI